ncbi:MAG: prepilin-type N-terminal cleavage/methylation domain-containing protein [bacterium]|nr:prepilin-type N-terminal cleavage/methylation domain-containing protein [bacterium]
MRPSSKGFTLIELLVVIAIIGLLSSIVLASLNTARSKGRDAHRVGDVHQLEIALALYFSKNGTYPNCSFAINDPPGHAASIICLATALKNDGDISSIPNDPLYVTPTPALGWSYAYDRNWMGSAVCAKNNDPLQYRLWAALENSTVAQSGIWWSSMFYGSWSCAP